jgi:hypothetical protein
MIRENLDLVLHGKADFYMVERMVGAAIAWRMKTLDQLDERRLKMTYNLHFLFSKKQFLMSLLNDLMMPLNCHNPTVSMQK